MKPNRFNILFHVSGWPIYTFLGLLNNPYMRFWDVLKVNLGAVPLYFGVAYILSVYMRKRGVSRGLVLLLALYPAVAGYVYGYVYGVLPKWGLWLQRPEAVFSLNEFLWVAGIFYLHLIVYAALVEATRRAWLFFRGKLKAEKERNRIRDSLLRFQISPHFQLNALNVIAANAANNRDHTTAAMVGIMASLQRYCVEATSRRMALVPISREIGKLREFVELVCLRHDGQQVMRLVVTGMPDGLSIPPVTLLTEADNMVRHGVLTTECPGTLHLTLQADGYRFCCRNRIRATRGNEPAQPGGLGLDNVSERLELLMPGQYTLETRKEGGNFIRVLIVKHTPHENTRHRYLRYRRR